MVNKDGFGFDFVGQFIVFVCVFGLDVGSEIKFVVVYQFDCFFVVFDFYYRKYGVKCFVYYDCYGVVYVGQQSGFYKVFFGGWVVECFVFWCFVFGVFIKCIFDVCFDGFFRLF